MSNYPELAIIVDLDGTLADVTAARHYVRQKPKNFDAFHEYGTTEAPVNEHIKRIVEVFDYQDDYILLVTGREERWRNPTISWLERNKVVWDFLWMRPDKDYRQDRVIKEEIYRREIEGKYDVLFALDDSPTVVALWRELDIPVLVVPGYEDVLDEAATSSKP